MPELILFDLGDVVCRFVPERRLAALAESSGLAPAEIHSRLWGAGLAASFDRGAYTFETQIDAIREALGAAFEVPTLMELWSLAFEVDPAVLAIAERLRSRYSVGLLTNNPPLLRAALPIHFRPIEDNFAPILFSAEFGTTKPDPELFAAVDKRVGLSHSDILLIDDSASNVDAARRHGWQAIRFTHAAALQTSLRAVIPD